MANKNGNESNLILINATQEEEIRVAITHKQYLDNLFIEEIGSHRTGNIYKARISRIVPSLQAVFVDFGSEKHGFLPFKEISSEYFSSQLSHDSQNIAPLIREGQEIVVQVVKEERGNKGAALTTFITLAGCYLVLMPNNPSAGGISRRIEGEERDQMREYINALNVPEHMGLIIRTAGMGRAQEEIVWDLDVLLRLWEAIKTASASRAAPFLIHQESDIVIRALRDYLRRDITQIIIDSPELYEQAKQHINAIRPEYANLITLYEDKTVPLFTRYRIEDQIESAFLREVQLPSGGFIVIEETEAMVTIDVNSARDTKGGNIEQTAFNTNREAAIEIARQLRLRDSGGLIAIDFIDMLSNENQQKILDVFKEEVRNDKARVQFNRISRFGILEVSRQRLRPSLAESSQIACPRCNGQGSIRSVESLGLLLLRLIRQEALYDNVIAVNVQVPIDVATFLVNEKRRALSDIETQHHILVRIFPNPHIQTPAYKLERVYEQSTQATVVPSFKQVEKVDFHPAPTTRSTTTSSRYSEPAIKGLEAPHKPVTRKNSHHFLARLWNMFAGGNETPEVAQDKPVETPTAVASMPHDMTEKKKRTRNHRQRQRPHNQPMHNNQPTHTHQPVHHANQPAHHANQPVQQANQPMHNTVAANTPAPRTQPSQKHGRHQHAEKHASRPQHQHQQHHQHQQQESSTKQKKFIPTVEPRIPTVTTPDVVTAPEINVTATPVISISVSHPVNPVNNPAISNNAPKVNTPAATSTLAGTVNPTLNEAPKLINVADLPPQPRKPVIEVTAVSNISPPSSTILTDEMPSSKPLASSPKVTQAPRKKPQEKIQESESQPASLTGPALDITTQQTTLSNEEETAQELDTSSEDQGDPATRNKRYSRHYRNRYRQHANHYRRNNKKDTQTPPSNDTDTIVE